MPWYRTITVDQWRTLAAAKLGWMLDAMDFMLYAMAIGQLRTYFGFNDATAGMLGTITLVMSGVGGVLFGYLADRLGRTRALMGTIVAMSARVRPSRSARYPKSTPPTPDITSVIVPSNPAVASLKPK